MSRIKRNILVYNLFVNPAKNSRKTYMVWVSKWHMWEKRRKSTGEPLTAEPYMTAAETNLRQPVNLQQFLKSGLFSDDS